MVGRDVNVHNQKTSTINGVSGNNIKVPVDVGKQIVSRTGSVMKQTFDPTLIANFQEVFNNTVHRHWKPIYTTDMRLNQSYDFFKTIVNRVRRYNESYDMTVVGDRGLGKSAFGFGSAIIIHNYFKGNTTTPFPMDNVCFDVESWIDRTNELSGHGGGVLILDEVGTEGSLSSRTSMSKGNRATSDIIQLCRTDRIITIYISTDRQRIDKRVRELASVMGSPIAKLSDEDTNGYGLAIEADIRYRRTRPGNDNSRTGEESGYLIHEVSPLHYGPKGVVYSVVVPHPPTDQWQSYSKIRDKKLEDVRAAGQVAYDGAGAGNMVDEMRQLKKNIDKYK